MKILKSSLFFMMVGICSLSLAGVSVAVDSSSPAGRWNTIDDATHKPRAVILISDRGGNLTGTLLQIYPQPGDTGICSKCPGSYKGKKIVGLTILMGLKPTGTNTWGGGRILDPKSGQMYSAKVTLSPDGKSLHVRGYIGLSAFGRTQTWVRQ